MELGGITVPCFRAPFRLQRAVLLRPASECGVLERSGSCATLEASKSCSTAAACSAGWRRGKSGPFISRRCTSGERGGLSLKNSPFVGARLHQAERGCLVMARAEKDGESNEEGDDSNEEDSSDDVKTKRPVTVKEIVLVLASADFWLQVGIFVFAAGFVDAGFSGDWSRIGVLSKQTEEELQMASIGVVPLAATLIWSISKRRKSL